MLIFKSALLFTFFAFFFEESSALVEAFDKTSFLLRCIFRSLPSKVKENVKKPSPSTLLTAAIDILVVKQRENLTDLMQTGNYNEFKDFSQWNLQGGTYLEEEELGNTVSDYDVVSFQVSLFSNYAMNAWTWIDVTDFWPKISR